MNIQVSPKIINVLIPKTDKTIYTTVCIIKSSNNRYIYFKNWIFLFKPENLVLFTADF